MNEKQLVLDTNKLGGKVMVHALQSLKDERDLKHITKEKFIELTTIKIINYLELLDDIGIIETDMFLSVIAKSVVVMNESYDEIIEHLYAN